MCAHIVNRERASSQADAISNRRRPPSPMNQACLVRITPAMSQLIDLQRLAGNAAVVASLQRQSQDGGSTSGSAGVHAGRFLNSGTSLLGRALGFHSSGSYYVNGIEIVFDLDPGARSQYSVLRPRQWSGPEAVYFKTGPPLASRWQIRLRDSGAGSDDPQPESQRVTNRAVIYDDSPGPSVLGHLGHTWIHAVQNFTGWVEGKPKKGGDFRRLTEVVAVRVGKGRGVRVSPGRFPLPLSRTGRAALTASGSPQVPVRLVVVCPMGSGFGCPGIGDV